MSSLSNFEDDMFFTLEDHQAMAAIVLEDMKYKKMNESLEWYGLEKFKKQMQVKFPKISEYFLDVFKTPQTITKTTDGKLTLKDVGISSKLSSVRLMIHDYLLDNFEELSNKFHVNTISDFQNILEKSIEDFSYYVSRKNKDFWHLEPNKVNIRQKKTQFIHVSRSPNLVKTGILPKSSGRFEHAPNRIYLLDVSTDSFPTIMHKAKQMVDMFNAKYKKLGIISSDETYYLYFITLSKDDKKELYVDTKMPVYDAYYVTSSIVNKNENDNTVQYICKI